MNYGPCPPQAPVPGYVPNPGPQAPVPGYIPNPGPQAPVPGYIPNPGPQAGPVFLPPYALASGGGFRTKAASQALNRMGLLTLAQTALSFFWQVPLLFLLMAVGVDVSIDPMGYLWLSAVLAPLATALPFVMYLLILRKDLSDYLKFERVGFAGGALCVLAGLALVLLSNYPAMAVQEFFSAFGYEGSSGYVSSAQGLPAILLELGVTAVLVPFLEEFAFRGVILSTLRRYGLGFSIVASALIFGMAHLEPATVVFATFSGLVFGFLYAKTNNLWLTVWIHGLNNGIAVVGSHTDALFGSCSGAVDVALMLVPVGLGLVALAVLLVFRRGLVLGPRPDVPAWPLSAGESALSLARAPMFWVALGLVGAYTLFAGVVL